MVIHCEKPVRRNIYPIKCEAYLIGTKSISPGLALLNIKKLHRMK